LQSPYADKIKSFNNLEYVEAPYETYPAYYEKMDVFIAPSDLEGGPIPLLESMMSNVVPVACDTGFARDFIQHETNGYIFAKDATLAEIIELVKKALSHKGNIRSTVEKYTWEYFSQQVQDCLKTK
jgi:glycosyltransferase involved in cell wall biosynthesis